MVDVLKYYCEKCEKVRLFKQLFFTKTNSKVVPLKASREHFVVECSNCGWRLWTTSSVCKNKFNKDSRLIKCYQKV